MLTDKQDYDEIYQKYKNLVMKAAYKYSGNYDIAEDITQSTFLQLYTLKPHFLRNRSIPRVCRIS